MGDAAEEESFKEAEKVTAPSDAPRLSKIQDCAGGEDKRYRGRGGCSVSAASRLAAQAGDLSAELINVSKPGLWGEKPWYIALTSFRGGITPTLAHFKLPL